MKKILMVVIALLGFYFIRSVDDIGLKINLLSAVLFLYIFYQMVEEKK
jgi:hypothetical protein